MVPNHTHGAGWPFYRNQVLLRLESVLVSRTLKCGVSWLLSLVKYRLSQRIIWAQAQLRKIAAEVFWVRLSGPPTPGDKARRSRYAEPSSVFTTMTSSQIRGRLCTWLVLSQTAAGYFLEVLACFGILGAASDLGVLGTQFFILSALFSVLKTISSVIALTCQIRERCFVFFRVG
jgi:hypothetical protein